MSESSRIIQYQPADLAEPVELVSAIRARRGGQLINLDRMLLHSTPFARGWNAFLKEVRENLSLDARLRELAMCGVAVLNGADYEYLHHAPVYLAAGGSQAAIEMLRHWESSQFDPSLFDALELSALALTKMMTRDIQVPDALMLQLKRELGEEALVELVGVIATYNMVSRFLVALKVTPEHHPE